MIAFASLFLGLILGASPVDIIVTGSVVVVELRLDEHVVGKRTGPPWRFDVNFGDVAEPHELVAVGFDAAGKEVSRARQTVNLPRPAAEATIVLEGGENGKGRVARLNWQSTVAAAPVAILLEFDGKDVPVSDGHRVELPDHDPEQLHFVRAELTFRDDIRAFAEIVFGGRRKGETLTALTAVPVLLDKKSRKLPPPALLDGWVVKEEQSLRVVAVEEGPALISVVPDLSAKGAIDALVKTVVEGEFRRIMASRGTTARGTSLTLTDPTELNERQRWRIVWPVADMRTPGDQHYAVFDKTADFSKNFLMRLRALKWRDPRSDQRLADAVGAAGLAALEDDRPRAVVLLLSAHPEDASEFTSQIVRRYLATVGIPLYVWCVESDPNERVRAWGAVTDVSNLARFEAALKKVVENLERQRIIWVEGTHLPQTLSLSSKAKDIALLK